VHLLAPKRVGKREERGERVNARAAFALLCNPEGFDTILAAEEYLGALGSVQMECWECEVCGYIYDPEVGDVDNGVAPGTPFGKLPDDWVCPLCGATKEVFKQL